MAPASLQLALFEPTIFLRGLSAVGEDPRGRRRPINFDAPPSQLRGLVTLQLPKPSKIKEISITLQGKAKTDWPEGIGSNRMDASEESVIFLQKVILFCAKESQPNQYRKRASSIGALQEESREGRQNVPRSYSSQTSAPLPLTSAERSPTFARSIGNAAARAGTAMLPPTLMREINASKQNSYTSRSASSSPMRSPSSSRINLTKSPNSYFDPPPLYDPNRQSISSSASSSNSFQANEETHSSFGDWSTESPENTDFPSTVQHPQSVNAAGPSNRSILHPPGRQEAKLQSTAVAGAGVRFDGAQQNSIGFFVSGPTSSTAAFPEPTSSRSSAEQARASQQSNGKGKGKGKSPSPAPSPGHGARKGIKGLLGNLLKEDDESLRSNTSSSNGHTALMEDDDAGGGDDQEFRKGTYTFSFSIPLPANLPPTLHTDFGSNTYMVRAHAHRPGPLTSNLTNDKEITLVHAPDEDGQDDNDAIVVEREWNDCLRYVVFVMGKSFPVGSKIPVWIKFVPTEKVRVHRIIASLEERTVYYAKGRKVTRHEVPRRWNLLKLTPTAENAKQGILPIISDTPEAILSNPLAPYAQAAVHSYTEASNVQAADLMASLMDPFGPWELAMDLEVPIQSTPLVNISSNHTKSNIAVSHLIKLAIRVERIQGNGEERKLFDILIEAPVTINHSHTANAWLSLPTYWSVGQGDRQLPEPTSSARSEDAIQNAPSSSANRRQTAPSLTPNRGLRGSVRVEAVNRPTSPPPPPLQGRINSNLVQLSQQWLSLSVNDEVPVTTPGSSTVEPQISQRPADNSGLPTYAMIDNARGSVDLPGRSSNKTSAR